MNNRKAIALACTVICAALGLSVGFSLNGGTDIISSFTPVSIRSVKEATEKIPVLCSSQMTQMLLIYLSGFTFFAPLVCSVILLCRYTLIAFSLSSVISMKTYTLFIPLISYLVITLFASLLSYKSMTYSGEKADNMTPTKAFLSHTLTFLTVSGASVFMKILSPMIFTR